MLKELKVIDFANMKSGDRMKLHRQLHKDAYSFQEEEKQLSTREAFNFIKGL